MLNKAKTLAALAALALVLAAGYHAFGGRSTYQTCLASGTLDCTAFLTAPVALSQADATIVNVRKVLGGVN